MTTTGPDPRHPPEAYREAVATLHANRPEEAVPVEAVAKHLDVSRSTVQKNLRQLYDDGELERKSEDEVAVGATGRGRPRYWYYPTEDAES